MQRRVKPGVDGTITADEARIKAREILAKAHLGEDFAEGRDKVRQSLTVAQLVDTWSEDGALPEHYDDRGLSGGTLERPALERC